MEPGVQGSLSVSGVECLAFRVHGLTWVVGTVWDWGRGVGKKETLCSASSSILILMAVSAARPLGSSVLFQVHHEAALLWVSPTVLLLSCESMVVVREP